MIRLVTQYSPYRREGERFRPGEGWDGAIGPFVFHSINKLDKQLSIAKYVKNGSYTITPEGWTSSPSHLTGLRLELIYE